MEENEEIIVSNKGSIRSCGILFLIIALVKYEKNNII